MNDRLPDHVGVLVGITQPDSSRPLSGWLKDPRSIARSGVKLVPRTAHRTLAVEAEVALIIGAPTAGVHESELIRCIRGWTLANDVTDLEQAALDPRTFQAKNGRSYTPIGPKLCPGLPHDDEVVSLIIDGIETSSATVRSLAVSPLDTLVFAARWIDLEPDDVVLTGALTPSTSITSDQEAGIFTPSCGRLVNTVGPSPRPRP